MADSNVSSPMRTFDPVKVARYEKESWVAYYQKSWLKLLRVFIGLVRFTFGLSSWHVYWAAYLLTRAQVAFAPKDNDIPLAESYMRRFFALIKQVHHEDIDVDKAARLEVNWWIVHRKVFGQSDDQALVDALVAAYAVEYNVPAADLLDAARHRALAMVYSDQWVRGGVPAGSPLLAQEEQELVLSYRALRDAVGPKP